MVGAVGEDVFGQALLDNLAKQASTPQPSRVSPDLPALPNSHRRKGQNSIVVVPGANAKVDAAAVDRQSALIRRPVCSLPA